MISNIQKIRFVSGVIYVAVAAAMWDIWWHQAIGGLDLFWMPPHILFYFSVTVALVIAVLTWWKIRDRLWRNVALALSALPFLRFIDSVWHGIFGVEDPESPVPIIFWSPPHLAIAAVLIMSAITLLPLIRREENPVARQLFSGLMLGAILTGFIFAVTPFQPLGPYHDFASAYFGPWGIGIVAAVFIGGLLFAERYMPGPGKVTVATVFFIILMSIVGMGQAWGGGLILSARQATPGWVITFAYLGTAVFFDLARPWKNILRGAAAGALFGAIFFFAASLIYADIWSPSFAAITTEILISALGGSVAGALLVKREKSHLSS